jgi:hypothetical protein
MYAIHGHQGWTKNTPKIEFLYKCFQAMLTLRPAPVQLGEELKDATYYTNQLQEDQEYGHWETRDAEGEVVPSSSAGSE